jgi:hypothetical protein
MLVMIMGYIAAVKSSLCADLSFFITGRAAAVEQRS